MATIGKDILVIQIYYRALIFLVCGDFNARLLIFQLCSTDELAWAWKKMADWLRAGEYRLQ